MRLSSTLLAGLSLAAVACGGKSGGGAKQPAVETTVVTDETSNAGGGDDAGAGSDGGDDAGGGGSEGGDPPPPRTPPGPSDDDRPNALLKLDPPELDDSLDPRTYAPAPYVPGAGRLAAALATDRLAVPHDGGGHQHPACARALPFASSTRLTPVIDGSLADWDKAQLVGVDRAGDGFTDANGTYDLKEMYWAEDDDAYYVGVRFHAAWPLVDDQARLIVSFDRLSLPTTDGTLVDLAAARSFEVYGDVLYEWRSGSAVDITGEADFDLAVQGDALELRIAKTQLAADLPTPRFGVRLRLWNGISGQDADDFMPSHLVGLVDAYACLVPMPGNTFKMLVLRHEAGVDPKEAEIAFRAMIAAAPAVEHVTGERYAHGDVLPLTITKTMAAAGTYHAPHGVIFMKHRLPDAFGVNHPLLAFEVAAHEYAHGLNAADYRLPTAWSKEGHSEWATLMALESYYGPAVAETTRRKRATRLQELDRTSGRRSLDAWQGTPHDYQKAGTFYDLLGDVIPKAALTAILRATKTGAFAPATTTAYLDRIKTDSAFKGAATATMWNGWLTGSYADSIFPMTKLADEDGDGLMAFVEARRGTDPARADTDGDGLSDGLEVAMGWDPKTPRAEPTGRFAADHLLDDWTALGLPLYPVSTALGAGCVAAHDMVRVGVAFDGDWLVIGVEMRDKIAGKSGALVAFLTAPGLPEQQIKLDYGSEYAWAFSGDTTLRPFVVTGAPTGKTIEAAYHRTWLGWTTFPDEVTVTVGTFASAAGNAAQCKVASDVKPSYPE